MSLSNLPGTSATTRREFISRVGAGSLAISVGGGLASLLSACGNQSPHTGSKAAPGATIKNLTVSFENSVPTLDIATAFVGNISTVMLLTQEPLLTYDNNLTLVPHLAESWSQPKPTEYVFTIRPGVTFWDGSTLTADDVVYSLARNIDPKFASQIAGYFTNVKEVRAAGPGAVAVTLGTPDETFPYILTLAGIVKKSVAEPLGNHYAQPGTTIVGTGPLAVKHFAANQTIQLSRYPNYWGQRPKLEAMSVQIIPDETSRQLAMRAGDTMMCYDVSVSNLRAWEQIPNVQVPIAPGLEVSFLSFDLTKAPWNDLHVRRAFAYCWDPKFVSAVMGKAATTATSVVPKGMWPNLLTPAATDQLYGTLPAYPFSIARAKAELAQSTMPHGFSANLATPNTIPNLEKAALSISQNLASIGIKLNVTVQPAQAWQSYQDAHQNLGLQTQAHGPDFPDPADYYSIFYLSSNASPQGTNIANYRSPEFDRLYAVQAGQTSKAARASTLGQMLRLADSSLAYIPYWWSGFVVAYRSDLMTYHDLTSLCYLQPWLDNITPA